MRICAFVPDLLDRSRISAALESVEFVRDADACVGADVVVVDLARSLDAVAAVRAVTDARIVGFGPHVDDALMNSATDAGADLVLPRSRFFRDVAGYTSGQGTE